MPSRRAPMTLSAQTCSSLPNTSSSTSQKPFVRSRFNQAKSALRPRTSPAMRCVPGTCQTTRSSINDASVASSPERNASAVRRYAIAFACSRVTVAAYEGSGATDAYRTAASSGDQRNASSSACDGVLHTRVCRGRPRTVPVAPGTATERRIGRALGSGLHLDGVESVRSGRR
jgi:hypothetical protein